MTREQMIDAAVRRALKWWGVPLPVVARGKVFPYPLPERLISRVRFEYQVAVLGLTIPATPSSWGSL